MHAAVDSDEDARARDEKNMKHDTSAGAGHAMTKDALQK